MRVAPHRRSTSSLRAVVCGIALASAWLGGARESAGHFAERTWAGRAPAPSLLPLPLSETAWIGSGFERYRRVRLAPDETLSLIGRYQRPWENHTPDWRAFFEGRYGLERTPPLSLTWRLSESLLPASLPIVITRLCPRWKAPRPLTVVRYAGEEERLPLFDCDGAIAPEVIDRLSVLARAPETPRPAIPLPEDANATREGEWLPGLRLLDPRLVWLLGEIQEAFPGRRVVIMSGYRPDAHTSFHKRGKALDLYVDGVPNEELFALCSHLRDVGCGFYPNNRFVHVDVRPFGTRQVTWVDVSEPGGTSRYVDGWPGVLPPGTAWLGGG